MSQLFSITGSLISEIDLEQWNSFLEFSQISVLSLMALVVPLSIQIVYTASKKYRTNFPVKFYFEGPWVSLQGVILSSFMFVVMTAFLRVVGGGDGDAGVIDDEAYSKLCCVFFVYFVCIALFVSLFFYSLIQKIGTTDGELFELYFFKRSKFISLSLQYKIHKLLHQYVTNRILVLHGQKNRSKVKWWIYQRYQVQVKNRLSDQADLIGSVSLQKISSRVLTDVIRDATVSVSRMFYDEGKKRFLEKTDSSVDSFSLLINVFLDVYRSSLKNGGGVSFDVQRNMFSLFGIAFHHPEFRDIFSYGYSSVVDVQGELVDMAEAQNQSSSSRGALVAEGEWLSYLASHNSIVHFNEADKSVGGLEAALSTWLYMVLSAAQFRPDRIVSLYESIRDAAIFNFAEHHASVCLFGNGAWVAGWNDRFRKLKPNLSSLPKYYSLLNELNEKKEDNLISGESTSIDISRSLDKTDIFTFCMQGSAFANIYKMFAILAKYNRWKELKECWYASQPADSSASYCDHQFFTRDPGFFVGWVVRQSLDIDPHRFMVGRSSYLPSAIQASIVILSDLKDEAGGVLPDIPINYPVIEIPSVIEILDAFRKESKVLIKEEVYSLWGWEKKRARQNWYFLESYFSKQVGKFSAEKERILNNIVLVDKGCSESRSAINNFWQELNSEFLRRVNRYGNKYTRDLDFEMKYVHAKSGSLMQAHQFLSDAGEIVRRSAIKKGCSFFRYFMGDVVSCIENSSPTLPEVYNPSLLWLIPVGSTSKVLNYLSKKYDLDIYEIRYQLFEGEGEFYSVLPEYLGIQFYDWGLPSNFKTGGDKMPVYGFLINGCLCDFSLQTYYRVSITKECEATSYNLDVLM